MAEPPRILIVEDDEGLAIHMKFLLNKGQYLPVDVVAYGEQAIQRAGELRPDLVLMDIHLAGEMDGIEAAEQIRDLYHIPIVYCSAVKEDETLKKAAGSGPYAYLVKPVKETELRMAIEVAIQNHAVTTLLRESERRQRQLIETMTNAFALHEIVLDEQGQLCDYRFLMINPAYERMVGIPAKRAIGHTLREALPGLNEEFYQYYVQTFGQVAIDGQPLHLEQMVPEVGRYLDINVYRPAPGQFAVVLDDVTERKAAEESQHQSNRRVKQNLDRMEVLRNIDQAIITHTDMGNMIRTVLDRMIELAGIDVAVLFMPSEQAHSRGPTGTLARRTGPLSVLRLAGAAGMLEEVLADALRDWMLGVANEAYYTAKRKYLYDLREETHLGAAQLSQMGFSGSVVLPLLAHGQMKGVLLFLHQRGTVLDGDWGDFVQSLALQTAIAIDSVEMLENLRRLLNDISHAYDETIKGWAKALELRDYETSGHSDRVSHLTVKLAEFMGMRGSDLTHIKHGALLHDVGKMAIPDSIIKKMDKLTDEDWVTMKQHPTKAYQLLKDVDFLRPAMDIVYCHHEKWDGTGYPRGLKGEDIPLAARIFAVVDVWDALTNDRYYRLAWPRDDVIKYIGEHSGRHFDPRVVEAFLRMI